MVILMDFFEQLSERARKINQHMDKETDTTMIILKGHLLVEETLSEILKYTLKESNPMTIKIHNMMFSQKANLVWALKHDKMKLNVWPSLKRLNTIRYKMAHSLEPSDIDALIEVFVKGVEKDWNDSYHLKLEMLDLKSAIAWVESTLGYILNQIFENDANALLINPHQ
jgi:hypothetical protein